MLVDKAEFKKALLKASVFIHKNNKATLKRILKLSKTSASVNAKYLETSSLALALSLSGLAKRIQEIKIFYKLVSLIRPLTYIENLEEAWAVRSARRAGTRKKKNIKVIPEPAAFIQTIRKLHADKKYGLVWSLLVMAASGRRYADVCRLEGSRIKQIGRYKYSCEVSQDKMNASPVKFRLDFQAIPPAWRPASLGKIDAYFRDFAGRASWPGKYIAKQNIARQISLFHPHGLRSLLAIYLTSLDVEDEKIMKIIGWKDMRSLMLYRRLSRGEIVGASVEKCVRKANLGL